jgi:hypothetical protein
VITGTELTVGSGHAEAGTLFLNACSVYNDSGTAADVDGLVWEGVGPPAFSTANRCAQNGAFRILPAGQPRTGQSVQWHTITPPSIEIVHAMTPANSVRVDSALGGDGFNASYFWDGGTKQITAQGSCCSGLDYGSTINRSLGPSRWFGWQVTCQSGPCGEPLQILDVLGVRLEAVDTTPPALVALGANNLWYQTGRWLRGGGWPASFQASADDGVCGLGEIIDGKPIDGPSQTTLNQRSWTQCPDPQTMSLTVDTTKYPDGPLSLQLSARDAANPPNVSSPSETLQVDNQPVWLSLSGPSDAPVTAGTQYVTASATAGPSGVAGIACSVDGAPYEWHSGSTVPVPIAGIGEHAIACYAQNNAIDLDGNPARSPTQTWSMKIGQPTVMAIAFRRLVDRLRCHRVRERVHVPAHWVTVRSHHKRLKVRVPASVTTVKVTRCHPRTVRKRITTWKTVVRHGKKRKIKRTHVVRVAVPPHFVNYAKRRVRFGRQTNVSGWLGTTDGTALPGRTVNVLSAADNGKGRFRPVRVVTTKPNGSWSARLRRGPSRLIEATYAGDPTTESTRSQQVQIVTPAIVHLHIRPRVVPWHSTIRLWGRVLGGQIPGDRQQLLRLRIGADGIFSTVGIPDITRTGRFRTSWTFHPGVGVVHYWFSVSTLNEADYAFAPGSSKRIHVTVGPTSH